MLRFKNLTKQTIKSGADLTEPGLIPVPSLGQLLRAPICKSGAGIFHGTFSAVGLTRSIVPGADWE